MSPDRLSQQALTAGYIKYWVAAVSVRTQCRRELAQHSVVVCAQIWNDDTNLCFGVRLRHLRAPLRGSHQFFTKGRVTLWLQLSCRHRLAHRQGIKPKVIRKAREPHILLKQVH